MMPLHDNAHLISALTMACEAVTALSAEGIHVLAAASTGNRPLLIVDRMPVDAVCGVKQRSPNKTGSTTVVLATSWHGCQLQTSYNALPKSTRVRLCGRRMEVANA